MLDLKGKFPAPIALAMACMLGCGGDGPVAVPPGTDLSGLKPASTSPAIPPAGKKSRGAKESSGPMPIPSR